jgi:hypothetical protein
VPHAQNYSRHKIHAWSLDKNNKDADNHHNFNSLENMEKISQWILRFRFWAFLGFGQGGAYACVKSIKRCYRCSADYRIFRSFIPRWWSSVLSTGLTVFYLCLFFLLLLTNGYAGPNKILIHYEANTDARTASIVSNASWIDSLPFDGLVINTPDSFEMLSPGTVTSYSDVYTNLSPLKGVLHNVTHNYFLVEWEVYADPFDDWTQEIANWVAAAEAARDCGFEGIFLDNEGGLGTNPSQGYWQYPNQVKYGSSKTLAAYQQQYYLRGQQLMAAIIAQWPACKFIYAHTEAESDPNEPMTSPSGAEPAKYGSYSWLSGFFGLGLFSYAPGQVIDGGELYDYRTAADFTKWYTFIRAIQPPLSPQLILPAEVSTWEAKSNVSFGIYDETFRVTQAAASFQSTIANALPVSDYVVWTYTDGNDYLKSSGAPTAYITAIWNARAAAGLSNPGPTRTPAP